MSHGRSWLSDEDNQGGDSETPDPSSHACITLQLINAILDLSCKIHSCSSIYVCRDQDNQATFAALHPIVSLALLKRPPLRKALSYRVHTRIKTLSPRPKNNATRKFEESNDINCGIVTMQCAVECEMYVRNVCIKKKVFGNVCAVVSLTSRDAWIIS